MAGGPLPSGPAGWKTLADPGRCACVAESDADCWCCLPGSPSDWPLPIGATAEEGASVGVDVIVDVDEPPRLPLPASRQPPAGRYADPFSVLARPCHCAGPGNNACLGRNRRQRRRFHIFLTEPSWSLQMQLYSNHLKSIAISWSPQMAFK